MRNIKRIIIFILGLLLLAFGIAISTISGLGISPLNCLAYVISVQTKIQMGYITMCLYIVYVLLEIPIKGKTFKLVDLLQIPVAILFGFFVNWTKQLVSGLVCQYYWQSIVCVVLSVILIAAGTTIYVVPQIALQAPEGLILAICKRWNVKFGNVKMGFDITIVVISFFVGIVFTGKVIGIREGTLIAAVGVGYVVGLFNKKLKPALTEWCSK